MRPQDVYYVFPHKKKKPFFKLRLVWFRCAVMIYVCTALSTGPELSHVQLTLNPCSNRDRFWQVTWSHGAVYVASRVLPRQVCLQELSPWCYCNRPLAAQTLGRAFQHQTQRLQRAQCSHAPCFPMEQQNQPNRGTALSSLNPFLPAQDKKIHHVLIQWL